MSVVRLTDGTAFQPVCEVVAGLENEVLPAHFLGLGR